MLIRDVNQLLESLFTAIFGAAQFWKIAVHVRNFTPYGIRSKHKRKVFFFHKWIEKPNSNSCLGFDYLPIPPMKSEEGAPSLWQSLRHR